MAYVYPYTYAAPLALLGSFALGLLICCCWTRHASKIRLPNAPQFDADGVVIPRIQSDRAYQREQRENQSQLRKFSHSIRKSFGRRKSNQQRRDHAAVHLDRRMHYRQLYNDNESPYDRNDHRQPRNQSFPMHPTNVQYPNSVALSATRLAHTYDNTGFQQDARTTAPYQGQFIDSNIQSISPPPSYNSDTVTPARASLPPPYTAGQTFHSLNGHAETEI